MAVVGGIGHLQIFLEVTFKTDFCWCLSKFTGHFMGNLKNRG